MTLITQKSQCVSVSPQDHDYLKSRKRGMTKRLTRDLPLVKLLNISITLSPFLGVDTTQFHASLVDGTEAYWLSLPSAPHGHLVRHLSGTFQRNKVHFLRIVIGPDAENIFHMSTKIDRDRHSCVKWILILCSRSL